jgi:hypothetical protein
VCLTGGNRRISIVDLIFLFVSRITAIPTEVQTLQLPNGFLGRGVDRHAHIIYSVAVDASMYRPALAVSMLMELL